MENLKKMTNDIFQGRLRLEVVTFESLPYANQIFFSFNNTIHNGKDE